MNTDDTVVRMLLTIQYSTRPDGILKLYLFLEVGYECGVIAIQMSDKTKKNRERERVRMHKQFIEI